VVHHPRPGRDKPSVRRHSECERKESTTVSFEQSTSDLVSISGWVIARLGRAFPPPFIPDIPKVTGSNTPCERKLNSGLARQDAQIICPSFESRECVLFARTAASSSHKTRPWRETDSNHQSRVRCKGSPIAYNRRVRLHAAVARHLRRFRGVGSRSAAYSVGGRSSRADMPPLETLVVSRGTDGSNPLPSSRQSVSHWKSRAAVEKRGFSRGCAGHGRWRGRQRRGSARDMAPACENVSAGPNPSTAVPVMSSKGGCSSCRPAMLVLAQPVKRSRAPSVARAR
jgi:hypothetical protein